MREAGTSPAAPAAILPMDHEDFSLLVRHAADMDRAIASFRASFHEEAGPRTRAALLEEVRSRLSKAVPAYAGLAGVGGLEDVPFMAKEDVRARLAAYVDAGHALADLRRDQTSGTTGPALTVVYSPVAFAEIMLLSAQKMALRAGVEEAFARPVFALHVWERQSRQPEFVLPDPQRRSGLLVKACVDFADADSVQRLRRLWEGLQPAVVASRPNVLEFMATCDALRHLDPAPVAVFSSGAELAARSRSVIEEGLRAPVFSAYALREFGVVASECASRRLHVDETQFVVEAVREDGAPCAMGEPGELVISNVRNDALPLLRYRTRDLCALEAGACACGAVGTRIARLDGRALPNFILPDGRFFSPTPFSELLRVLPIQELQVTQLSVDQLDVRVEMPKGLEDVAAALRRVQAEIEARYPAPATVTITQTRFVPGEKFQRYRTLVERR